jgi:hypothetical protein
MPPEMGTGSSFAPSISGDTFTEYTLLFHKNIKDLQI